jgi:uncharacterized protein (DUF433 family)
VTDLVAERTNEPWRRRLYLPNYQIGEASHYAHISPQTVAAWHKVAAGRKAPILSARDKRVALSYMQLIEVAVVAAFRRAGVSLRRIRDARDYISKQLDAEFPFALYQFKTDGRHLLLTYQQVEGRKGRGKHLVADEGGQLEWDEIIGPLLKEFDYEHEGIVIRWHLAGRSSPIVIDPRFSFGAPTVNGTPTWAVVGRWNAGETDSDIADDLGLTKEQVKAALRFEGMLDGGKKKSPRLH